MALLVDLFGYIGILLHGCAIVAQSLAIGGALFLLLLVRPLYVSGRIAMRCERLAAASAAALAIVELLNVALQGAVLVSTVDLPWSNVLQANFAVAGMVKAVAAVLLAVAVRRRAPAALVVGAGFVVLLAAIFTTHAAARLSDNALLLTVEFLHQFGAAIWIGGIPYFLILLAWTPDAASLRLTGWRFSRMSMAGVACLLASGITMTVYYIGGLEAFYGTAYGVMVGAKIAMFAMLLALGLGNLLVTERLRRDGAAPVLRLRRFAEVEIGIGITIFFAAASLTSVPPAIDLTQDRASWQEIVARDFTPEWPRLTSPDHDKLAIPALQAELDREARARAQSPRAAFVEGSGDLPPRNAEDIAWSEYNHHWAGLFVLAIGALALLNRAGLRWARHWPLVFLGLAAFLFVRSDPEVWPLGQIGLIESLRDVEVAQHRVFVLLAALLGLFEWAVRTGRLKRPGYALVFPLLCSVGGALLLTHQHAIANVKDQLLIEWTHTPLALAAIAAGWSRWLELRLPGPVARVAGWVWPCCLLMIGVLLLLYREA